MSAIGIGNGKAKFRFTPTTEMVPPGAAHRTASLIVWSAPDRLDHRLRAAPAGGLVDLGDGVAAGGVDGLGAELLGAGQAVGDHVDGEDPRRPVELGALQGEHADRPEPDHHDGVARGDVGALRAEVAGGEDVGEQHGLLVGDALGDLDDRRVGRRHGDRLGLAAGQLERGAEHLGAGVAAHADVARPAGRSRGRSRSRPTRCTRSPLPTVVTALPTSSTVPTNSWPRCTPGIVIGPWYRCRSLPQMAVRSTRSSSPSGPGTPASGTSSTGDVPLPVQHDSTHGRGP